MKQKFKIIIPILAFCLFGYLTYHVILKMQHKSDVSNTLKTIPEFSFKTLNGRRFSNADLNANTNTIFIYYNTVCDFCQSEAQSISEKIEQFKTTELLFVSTENKEAIQKFANKYNLSNRSNITLLYDDTRSFSNRFDANSIPYILIYDKNHNLVRKHKGQLKSDAILKTLYPMKEGI